MEIRWPDPGKHDHSMLLIWLVTLILFTAGVLEKLRHRTSLGRLPVRIHIGGTRGKSLLVRMITDLLTQAGWSVTARTTGTELEVFSNATGWTARRRQVPARIKEQLRFIRQSSLQHCQALAVENMALRPESQHVAESHIIRSSLGIITNLRPDHQEVAPTGNDEIPAALAFSFPKDSTLLMPGREVTPVVRSRLEKLHTKLITAQPSPGLPETDHPVFGPHFALLKAVQKHYRLPDEAYLQAAARWRERLRPESFLLPFPGAKDHRRLVDLFSCNDVTSAREMVRWLEGCQLIRPPYDILLTCRADRPLRTGTFLEWLLPALGEGRLILAGGFPLLAVDRLRRRFGIPARAVRKHARIDPERIASELADREFTVIGLGNYVKTGEKILSYLKKDLI